MVDDGRMDWQFCSLLSFQETDYAMSYFDNGEGYGDDDDGDDEGPVYWETT